MKGMSLVVLMVYLEQPLAYHERYDEEQLGITCLTLPCRGYPVVLLFAFIFYYGPVIVHDELINYWNCYSHF